MTPIVFLDANVLYSGTCRSLFIWLRHNGAIQIYWSNEAWDEVFRNYAANNPSKAFLFQESMRKNAINFFPQCTTSVGQFKAVGLTDPDDEHILAAAKACNADVILTNDIVLLNDLDTKNLGVNGLTPDQFITDILVPLSPSIVKQSAQDHISSLTTSQPTKLEYIHSLRKSSLTDFADWCDINI